MSQVKIIKENSNAGGGMVYCLGVIGALVYYWQNADTFKEFVIGLVKALLWPGFLIHRVLQLLNM